ncbi:hypothetical protein OCAR_4929 [Afipia carboxidovorans OM5]|nr:hypothetical protein OCAR_4929 [Afipia carboxidovorans OM5]
MIRGRLRDRGSHARCPKEAARCRFFSLARSMTSGDPEQAVFNASLTIVVLTLLTASGLRARCRLAASPCNFVCFRLLPGRFEDALGAEGERLARPHRAGLARGAALRRARRLHFACPLFRAGAHLVDVHTVGRRVRAA